MPSSLETIFQLFSVIHNTNLSTTNLNSDLRSKRKARANWWKMTFNPDPNKQAQESIFTHKIKKTSLPPLNFNNSSAQHIQYKKTWVFIWTVNWTFVSIFKTCLKKQTKESLYYLRKLRNNLPTAPLVTIYKSFERPHLNYRDISFGQSFNSSF